jgi:hypothetical protein
MRHAVVCFLVLLALALPAQEKTQKYVWPLSIDNGVSSTFQEFRANHFHAGIDLRTFRTTGFPVRAVADGAIEKIIVSNIGIGRAIFLRHRDGKLSIYGHLEKFSDGIESLVIREQSRRKEKYFGEHVLAAPMPVNQGAIIAFSGESGSGFPHLHLEIRDEWNRSLNPLTLIDSPSVDDRAPIMKGILLRSCGSGLINGDLGEFYYELIGNGPLITLAETLEVTGPFDLVLHTYDQTAQRQVVAPYSLEAFLDGQPVYQIAFDRLQRDDNNQLGMLYDMSYSTSSSFFYKVFSQNGFVLENRRLPFAASFDRLPPGAHEIKMVVKDRQQNQAVALIPFRKLAPPEGTAAKKEYDLAAGADRVLFNADLSIYVHRDDVVVKIRDFPRPASWISLRVSQGEQAQVVAAQEYGAGVFFCFKPLNDEMNLQLRFVLSDGVQPVEVLQKNMQLLVLKNHTAREFHSGDFSAEFAEKTVLDPTVLLLERKTLAADYPLLAGPVSIGPTHFTFLDTVFFKFRIPADQPLPEQLGIFKYQPLARKWRYIKTQNVREAGYLGARILSGGIFALLRDIYPPEIHFRIRRNRALEKTNKLVVHLRDKGKGIDERSVVLFLNGQKSAGEYDPDWGHILIDEFRHLRKGSNDLVVHAADFAGNHSEKRFTFKLK